MPAAPASVTLVVGDEELLGDRAVTTAVRAATGALGEGTTVERVDAGALPDGFAMGLATRSLFGGGRIVVIDRAQELDAQARAAVMAVAADPVDGVVLVLRAQVPGRQARFLNELGERAKVVKVSKLKPAERNRWVKAELRGLDRRADERAVAAIVDQAGSELRDLAGAIAKLHVAVPPPAPITADHVAEHLTRTAERGIFEFTDAVLGGDARAGLAHAAALIDQGEDPLGLLSLLARQLRLLVRVADYPGASSDHVAAEIGGGVRGWQVDRARRQLRRWEPARLRGALAVVAEADAEVRSGALPQRVLLELVVTRLAGAIPAPS
jgi:DNA polymerase III subunit delta